MKASAGSERSSCRQQANALSLWRAAPATRWANLRSVASCQLRPARAAHCTLTTARLSPLGPRPPDDEQADDDQREEVESRTRLSGALGAPRERPLRPDGRRRQEWQATEWPADAQMAPLGLEFRSPPLGCPSVGGALGSRGAWRAVCVARAAGRRTRARGELAQRGRQARAARGGLLLGGRRAAAGSLLRAAHSERAPARPHSLGALAGALGRAAPAHWFTRLARCPSVRVSVSLEGRLSGWLPVRLAERLACSVASL